MKHMRKWGVFLLAVMLFAGALFPKDQACASEGTTQADGSADQAEVGNTPTDGWDRTTEETFYYQNGRRVTGWRKINKKYYYFDENGVLQTNRIAGNKKKGCYYVDADGVRVTDSAINYAVRFVMKYSKARQTPEQRLKSCFKALCRYSYTRSYSNHPNAKVIRSYALDAFKSKKANCFRYGAAFAYIARVLGFDSRYADGSVIGQPGRDYGPHGWCEVKIDGKWKICDCSMHRAHKESNFYLVEWKDYSYPIRRKKVYTMQVKNGKVSWK